MPQVPGGGKGGGGGSGVQSVGAGGGGGSAQAASGSDQLFKNAGVNSGGSVTRNIDKSDRTHTLDMDTIVSPSAKGSIPADSISAMGGNVVIPPIVVNNKDGTYSVRDGADVVFSAKSAGQERLRAIIGDSKSADLLIQQRQAFKSLKPRFQDTNTPFFQSKRKSQDEPGSTSLVDLSSISNNRGKPNGKLTRLISSSHTNAIIPVVKQTGVDSYELVWGHEVAAAYKSASKRNPGIPDRLRVYVVRSDAELNAVKSQIQNTKL